MKRCTAININRAIKELRKAEKNAGAWSFAIHIEVLSLERMLLLTGNVDLLDARALKDIEEHDTRTD